MNKTIADAYKELKGDLGNTYGAENLTLDCVYLFHSTSVDGEYIVDDSKSEDGGVWQYICTVEEFNNYKGDVMNDNKAITKSIKDYILVSRGQLKTTFENRMSVWTYDDNTEILLPENDVINHRQSVELINDAIDELATANGVSFNNMEKQIAELKGDLGNSFAHVGSETKLGYFDGDGDLQYICTVEQFNNYKDDDVKTVLDAVIDLSGYWSDNEEMVVVRFSSVWSFTDYMPPLESRSLSPVMNSTH